LPKTSEVTLRTKGLFVVFCSTGKGNPVDQTGHVTGFLQNHQKI